MNLKKSLIFLILFAINLSYAHDNGNIIVKDAENNLACNSNKVSELEKNVLTNICCVESICKLGISEKKAEEIRDKLCALELKEHKYCEEINKIAEKQLLLLMGENFNEKEIYKLVDEIGALKIKIAKLKVDAIILMKKNFTVEQIKQLK